MLVTGCAGFIGFHTARRLLTEGYQVIGYDNLNDYYDQTLKQDRLHLLTTNPSFHFVKGSLENIELLQHLFTTYKPKIVLHLAAQAGVRYSIENPHAYVQSNITGFMHLIECCQLFNVQHLLYASSSSVYGGNDKIPFCTTDRVDQPISVYAATKRSNELFAYTYSHLHHLRATGLRFFTVYGPWGRPDMALYTFANSILKDEPISLYNNGKMERDFTYIDDVVESIYRLMKKGHLQTRNTLHEIHNIGSNSPVQIEYIVQLIERELNKKAHKRYTPIQPGDVKRTYANLQTLIQAIQYQPTTSIEEGVRHFITWYKQYHNILD
ncbi:NAD-dependent epimerase [Pontibacillus litoralis JSM 072002]|uniref:NAD-dependent epimerase n=1 Tax=Pontibacillus litoralis JSM 072002 TaxID=1385512 RepID=A0A0A5G4T9_9BACI|nr:NAD-dependent epimerase [Pontibacillus litoralis JSM 072002]